MKLLCILIAVFFLAGCTPTDQERVEEAMDVIDFERTFIEEAPHLPREENEVSIDWTSERPSLMHPQGHLNRPIESEGVQRVEMEATFSYGAYTDTKTYTFDTPPYEARTLTHSETVDLENLAGVKTQDEDQLDLHFSEERPYIEIDAFLKMLEGTIDYDGIEQSAEGPLLTLTYDDASLAFDFEANTVQSERIDFAPLIHPLSDETLSITEEKVTLGEGLMLNLGAYRFDLIRDDGGYYLPLRIAGMLLTDETYDVYFNGETLFLANISDISEDEEMAMQDGGRDGERIPYNLRIDTFNYLALQYDHFHGRSDISPDTDSHYAYFADYLPELLGTSRYDHFNAVIDITHRFDDDVHTAHRMTGPYLPGFFGSIEQDAIDERLETYRHYQSLLEDYCAGRARTHTEEGIGIFRMGYIGQGSVEELLEALDEFKDSGIEKIVLDLSCTEGGETLAAVRTLSLLTDEDIPFRRRHTLEQSAFFFYHQSEESARDADFYIRTSPLTKGAGHYLARIAQELDAATVIGTETAGGPAGSTTMITPSGAAITKNSPYRFINAEGDDEEGGVTPAFILGDDALKDDAPLIDIILEE